MTEVGGGEAAKIDGGRYSNGTPGVTCHWRGGLWWTLRTWPQAGKGENRNDKKGTWDRVRGERRLNYTEIRKSKLNVKHAVRETGAGEKAE